MLTRKRKAGFRMEVVPEKRFHRRIHATDQIHDRAAVR
jgi:hypothetical protein